MYLLLMVRALLQIDLKRVGSESISPTGDILKMSKKDSARDRDRRILSPERKAEEGSCHAFNGVIL